MVSEYDQERKGFWREPDGLPTSEALALEVWVREAYALLSDTAGSYHATLGAPRFAELLQERSGIHTTRPPERWLDKVLGPVAAVCEHAGEPPLASLVVAGHDDLDAARRRLECYRWAGSAPADGGVPAPLVPAKAPRVRAARPARVPGTRAAAAPRPEPTRRAVKVEAPVNVCPSCFMAIPATGLCDNCD